MLDRERAETLASDSFAIVGLGISISGSTLGVVISISTSGMDSEISSIVTTGASEIGAATFSEVATLLVTSTIE
ncbi:MAG: hypothetical protein RLZZ577_325 [Bacteroidota bacterium]